MCSRSGSPTATAGRRSCSARASSFVPELVAVPNLAATRGLLPRGAFADRGPPARDVSARGDLARGWRLRQILEVRRKTDFGEGHAAAGEEGLRSELTIHDP